LASIYFRDAHPLAEFLRAREQSAAMRGTANDTSVILFGLAGGPSHLDLYDIRELL
jgi:hypothetical protein